MEKYETKRVKKVTITVETIEIVCIDTNGIISTTIMFIDRDTLHEDAVRVLQKHNLQDCITNSVMDDIVIALSIDETGTLLKNYIVICEKGESGEKPPKVILDSFPEICFDLRDLRNY